MSSPSERPAPVELVAGLMSTYQHPWFLCGGWAVDSWLGRVTRDHGDIDVSVFHDDQRALFDHLADWHLIAHDPNVPGATTELWNGRPLDLPAHIHARPRDPQNLDALNRWVKSGLKEERDGRDLEIILNARANGGWLLNEQPLIALPLDRAIQRSPWGLPTAAPEALLFYKATAYLGQGNRFNAAAKDLEDEADFRALAPTLSADGRRWLHDAIEAVRPGHPWLSAIEA